MQSIFTDKQNSPTDSELKAALGETYALWQAFAEYVRAQYPTAIDSWAYSKSGGWNFSLKDKKRAIIYLLPRDHYFKVALVFGQKATDEVMKNDVATTIKAELESAKVYAEGRGIRIKIRDETLVDDIKTLIHIKLKN